MSSLDVHIDRLKARSILRAQVCLASPQGGSGSTYHTFLGWPVTAHLALPQLQAGIALVLVRSSREPSEAGDV